MHAEIVLSTKDMFDSDLQFGQKKWPCYFEWSGVCLWCLAVYVGSRAIGPYFNDLSTWSKVQGASALMACLNPLLQV